MVLVYHPLPIIFHTLGDHFSTSSELESSRFGSIPCLAKGHSLLIPCRALAFENFQAFWCHLMPQSPPSGHVNLAGRLLIPWFHAVPGRLDESKIFWGDPSVMAVAHKATMWRIWNQSAALPFMPQIIKPPNSEAPQDSPKKQPHIYIYLSIYHSIAPIRWGRKYIFPFFGVGDP